MRPRWESGWRGRLYALGRRAIPLPLRRAVRRRITPERLLGLRKPAPELTLSALDPGRPVPGRSDLLILPVIPWSYRRQRPQQLAEAMARLNRRVFYGSLAGSGEPAEPAGVASGVTLLPIEGVRREDPWDRRLGGSSLARAAASIGGARERFSIREAALFAQSPFWGPLCEMLRERFGWRIVYDCIDAYGEFPATRTRARLLADAEARLAASADLVVATSESLRGRLVARARGGEVHWLPNACDYALFAGLPLPSPDPDRLTVGYVGAVDAWFDLELLGRLAELEPGWRFEIVGGIEDVAARLPRRSNVDFLGERPYREMPELRRRFDVEIIPFRLSELTHSTDPVKLYEAAAAGRAVVATPMRSLEPLARRGLGVVRLAATAEAFAREIRAAAVEAAEGPEAAERRRAFARENTWDVRARALEGWLSALGPASAPRASAGGGAHE
ncbi:MAG TPA: glycosyltransferase [Thermoanaerobaculia bacterium]|jgi:glycosyltransferase involved in cell wall biosynthesis